MELNWGPNSDEWGSITTIDHNGAANGGCITTGVYSKHIGGTQQSIKRIYRHKESLSKDHNNISVNLFMSISKHNKTR